MRFSNRSSRLPFVFAATTAGSVTARFLIRAFNWARIPRFFSGCHCLKGRELGYIRHVRRAAVIPRQQVLAKAGINQRTSLGVGWSSRWRCEVFSRQGILPIRKAQAKTSRKNTAPNPLHSHLILVGVTGFEPATSWSQTTRSTKLSYTPDAGSFNTWLSLSHP